jgi:hypothetical protein
VLTALLPSLEVWVRVKGSDRDVTNSLLERGEVIVLRMEPLCGRMLHLAALT